MILKGIVDNKYELTLLQLNEKPLGGIENFYDFSFSPAFADIGELSFNLPKYANDDNGNKVLNQIYERISEDMLVEVNGEHIFYIDRVSEKSDKDQEYKEIHAYSREYELSHKRLVNYKVEGRFLYYIEPDGNNGFPFNDSTYPEDIVKFPTIDSDGFYLGLFNEIERLTSWKLKRDSVTGHPIIPTELAKKTRGFDISDANLTEVLKNIQEAFSCIFVYDTKNREIKIIEVGDLVDSGFMISDKNFIESITKDLQISKTITRLNVYDKDGKGIGRKMAHGKDYIENYSYYMNDKFMSEELISALQEYIDINNSYMTATSQWWNLYDRATAERSEVELIILKYKEELIPHFVTIDILTTKRDGGTNADGTVIPPGALTSTEIAQLNNARIEYDRINKKIKTLEEGYVYTTPRSLPVIDYDINKAKDELDKQSSKVDMESVFSDYEVTHSLPVGSLMNEMDSFIKIDTYSLDYSANLEDIYSAGVKALEEVSRPPLQFEVGDVVDFLQVAEYEDLSNALQLGAYTTIEHAELGFRDKVLLLSYTHKPDSNSISLQFSNTLGYLDEYSDIAQLIGNSKSVGSRVDLNSPIWGSGGRGAFENEQYTNQNIKDVQIVANSKNKISRGTDEPTGRISKGDLWYKPTADGETEMYQWNGEEWVLIVSTGVNEELNARLEDAKQVAENARDEARSADDKATAIKEGLGIGELVENHEDIVSGIRENVGDRLDYLDSEIEGNSQMIAQIKQSPETEILNYQKITETVDLYERIIGETENDVKNNVARIVMSDSIFETEVKDAIADTSTQVTQLADNWAVKNINSAGDIVSQINLSPSNAYIQGKNIILDGNTVVDGTFTVTNNMIASGISASKITTGQLNAADVNIINLNADNISTGTLTSINIVGGNLTGGDVYLRNSSGNINAGMSSSGTASTSIRMWAGSTYANRESAPFRVQQNGKMIATNADINGKITSDTGQIGIFNIKPGEIEAIDNVQNWWLRIGAPVAPEAGGGKSPLYLGGYANGYWSMRAMIYPDGRIQGSRLISSYILPSSSSGTIGESSDRFGYIYLKNQPNVSSDVRQKNSIQDIPEGLIEKLKELEPKMFKQNDAEDGLWHFGYIAQDVERVLYQYALEEVGYENAQEYVKDFAFLHKDESYLSLLYGEIAVLREKEMRDRIASLESQIEELKGV